MTKLSNYLILSIVGKNGIENRAVIGGEKMIFRVSRRSPSGYLTGREPIKVYIPVFDPNARIKREQQRRIR